MTKAEVLSVILFAVSLVLSSVKLIEWWVQADPRSLVRAGRWAIRAAGAAALVLVAVLLFNRQWLPAMLVGSAFLVSISFIRSGPINPRRLAAMFAQSPSMPPARSYRATSPSAPASDPELARRAVAVLERYIAETRDLQAAEEATARPPAGRHRRQRRARQRGQLSRAEALEVLGLDDDTDEADVRDAHRRLMQIVHPDRGGSKYLASKLNEAKATLLGAQRAE